MKRFSLFALMLAFCLLVTVLAPAAAFAEEAEEIPLVYFTDDISPEGLVAVYEALGWTPTGKVAVKLSTGEPPASNYLRPELIADLVQKLDGTIVECNTAYGGFRAATAEHYQVAEDHGYTDIAPFQILDEYGSMEIPVIGGTRLTGDNRKTFVEINIKLVNERIVFNEQMSEHVSFTLLYNKKVYFYCLILSHVLLCEAFIPNRIS